MVDQNKISMLRGFDIADITDKDHVTVSDLEALVVDIEEIANQINNSNVTKIMTKMAEHIETEGNVHEVPLKYANLAPVEQAINRFPTDGATGLLETVLFKSNPIGSLYGFTTCETTFVIATDPTFKNIIKTVTVEGTECNINVSELGVNKMCYWRCYHRDPVGNVGNHSIATRFRTNSVLKYVEKAAVTFVEGAPDETPVRPQFGFGIGAVIGGTDTVVESRVEIVAADDGAEIYSGTITGNSSTLVTWECPVDLENKRKYKIRVSFRYAELGYGPSSDFVPFTVKAQDVIFYAPTVLHPTPGSAGVDTTNHILGSKPNISGASVPTYVKTYISYTADDSEIPIELTVYNCHVTATGVDIVMPSPHRFEHSKQYHVQLKYETPSGMTSAYGPVAIFNTVKPVAQKPTVVSPLHNAKVDRNKGFDIVGSKPFVTEIDNFLNEFPLEEIHVKIWSYNEDINQSGWGVVAQAAFTTWMVGTPKITKIKVRHAGDGASTTYDNANLQINMDLPYGCKFIVRILYQFKDLPTSTGWSEARAYSIKANSNCMSFYDTRIPPSYNPSVAKSEAGNMVFCSHAMLVAADTAQDQSVSDATDCSELTFVESSVEFDHAKKEFYSVRKIKRMNQDLNIIESCLHNRNGSQFYANWLYVSQPIDGITYLTHLNPQDATIEIGTFRDISCITWERFRIGGLYDKSMSVGMLGSANVRIHPNSSTKVDCAFAFEYGKNLFSEQYCSILTFVGKRGTDCADWHYTYNTTMQGRAGNKRSGFKYLFNKMLPLRDSSCHITLTKQWYTDWDLYGPSKNAWFQICLYRISRYGDPLNGTLFSDKYSMFLDITAISRIIEIARNNVSRCVASGIIYNLNNASQVRSVADMVKFAYMETSKACDPLLCRVMRVPVPDIGGIQQDIQKLHAMCLSVAPTATTAIAHTARNGGITFLAHCFSISINLYNPDPKVWQYVRRLNKTYIHIVRSILDPNQTSSIEPGFQWMAYRITIVDHRDDNLTAVNVEGTVRYRHPIAVKSIHIVRDALYVFIHGVATGSFMFKFRLDFENITASKTILLPEIKNGFEQRFSAYIERVNVSYDIDASKAVMAGVVRNHIAVKEAGPIMKLTRLGEDIDSNQPTGHDGLQRQKAHF